MAVGEFDRQTVTWYLYHKGETIRTSCTYRFTNSRIQLTNSSFEYVNCSLDVLELLHTFALQSQMLEKKPPVSCLKGAARRDAV